jgi:hypothetical protein
LAKIRIRAATWMPATMPNIFRIFMIRRGLIVGLKMD